MRLRSIALVLAILCPALPACTSGATSPELTTTGSDERPPVDEDATLLLVTVRSDHDYTGCVASTEAIDGLDVLLELPLLSKLVTTSALRSGEAARALLDLHCVDTVEYDDTAPDSLCSDFAASWCDKAFACLTPEELAGRGWSTASDCVVQQETYTCQLLGWCSFVDLEAAPACIDEVGSASCDLFRANVDSLPLVYPACQQVCVL